MKKILSLAVLLGCINSTTVLAETNRPVEEFSEAKSDEIIVSEDLQRIDFNNTTYVPERDTEVKFFIGLETPLISYSKARISNDNQGISIKNTESNLNEDIFDGLSLNFGLNFGNSSRVAFLISQNSKEIANVDTSFSACSLRFDIGLNTDTKVTPFVRFGLGYVSLEDETDELSALSIIFGFGGNYSFSENAFGYVALNYSFLPDADTGHSDLTYKEQNLFFTFGLGYKF